MNQRPTVLQLRAWIKNGEARLAWYGVILEEFDADSLPRDFHTRCSLARQVLRCRQELLALITSPAESTAPETSAGFLATAGATQPASSLHV